MSISAPQPIREELVDPTRFITRSWRNYLFAVQSTTNASTQVLTTISLSQLNGSTVTTPVPTGALSAGYYRISVYELIGIAAATSSSLTVTIGWTDGGLFCQRILPALTTNVAGANASDVFPIHVDNASPITYSAAYASNGAGQMRYDLGVIVESL